MNAKDKVVSQPMAAQLAQAGWTAETEWSWAQITASGGVLVRYAKLTSMQRGQYPLYPAPDVSELLEALRPMVTMGTIALAMEPDHVTVDCLTGFVIHHLTAATTPDVLAQLWVQLSQDTSQRKEVMCINAP